MNDNHPFPPLPSGSAAAVEPEVYIVGQTEINGDGIAHYLESIGADDWAEQWRASDAYRMSWGAQMNPEALVEFFGRLCYASFGVGINPNITSVRTDSTLYLRNIIDSGHGSVLEHVSVNIVLKNVSRVVTHELVRHRHGAISQESMRYVRLDAIKYHYPEPFTLHPHLFDGSRDVNGDPMDSAVAAEMFSEWWGEKMSLLAQWQVTMAEAFDIENKPFHDKKLITDAMRYLAPHGVATNYGWSSNFRELRHVLETRTAPGANFEVRRVIGMLGDKLISMFPKCFGDFEKVVDTDGPMPQTAYVPRLRSKV